MKRVAWISGFVVVACVATLLSEYVVASIRRDPLAKQFTASRLNRKSRDQWLAWFLIAASAAFLASARRVGFSPRGALDPQDSSQFSPASRRNPKPAPPLDLSFVDQAIAQHGRTREAAIPLLQAIQTHYRYLPDEALRRLCELTEITPAQIAGVSSFYGQFRRTPVGEHLVRVCHGTACHVSGARQITEELRRYLAIPEGADTDPAREFTIDEVACLGCCSLAPVLMVDGHTAGKLTPTSARQAVARFDREPA